MCIIENMGQTGCLLLAKSGGGVDGEMVYYLGKVNKVAITKPLTPGDQILTTVTIDKAIGPMCIVTAKCKVDGNLVARGELMFTAAPANPPAGG